jgi:hypothetical protein
VVGGSKSIKLILDSGVRGCECGPESDDGSVLSDSEDSDSSILTLDNRPCDIPPLNAVLWSVEIFPKDLLSTVLRDLG